MVSWNQEISWSRTPFFSQIKCCQELSDQWFSRIWCLSMWDCKRIKQIIFYVPKLFFIHLSKVRSISLRMICVIIWCMLHHLMYTLCICWWHIIYADKKLTHFQLLCCQGSSHTKFWCLEGGPFMATKMTNVTPTSGACTVRAFLTSALSWSERRSTRQTRLANLFACEESTVIDNQSMKGSDSSLSRQIWV